MSRATDNTLIGFQNTIRQPPNANANMADRPARVPSLDARRPARSSLAGRGTFLTAVDQGALVPISHPEFPRDQDIRNGLRLHHWRQRQTLPRSDRAHDCQHAAGCAPGQSGAAFSPNDTHVNDDEEACWQACLGLIGLIVFIAGMIAALFLAADDAPETDCRHQWTSDSRWVEHCNHHDGNGFVESRGGNNQ